LERGLDGIGGSLAPDKHVYNVFNTTIVWLFSTPRAVCVCVCVCPGVSVSHKQQLFLAGF